MFELHKTDSLQVCLLEVLQKKKIIKTPNLNTMLWESKYVVDNHD